MEQLNKFEEMYNRIMQSAGKLKERKLQPRHIAFESKKQEQIPEDQLKEPAPVERDGANGNVKTETFSRVDTFSGIGFGDGDVDSITFNSDNGDLIDLFRNGFKKAVFTTQDGEQVEFSMDDFKGVYVSTSEYSQESGQDDSEFDSELERMFNDEQSDLKSFMDDIDMNKAIELKPQDGGSYGTGLAPDQDQFIPQDDVVVSGDVETGQQDDQDDDEDQQDEDNK